MDNRNRKITIRFDEATHKEITEQAENSDLSVSEYIRRLLFGRAVTLINVREFLPLLRSLISELRQSGNNINQLAKYANYAEKNSIVNVDIIVEFNRLLREHTKVERKIEALGRKIMKA